MSTDYAPLKPIRFADVFDGRLERFGVTEAATDSTTETSRCLTDGNNHLWVWVVGDGYSNFTRYAPGGEPGGILQAIGEAFDADFVTEHEPQYWGFETQEEWEKAGRNVGEERGEWLYEQAMKYVRGDHNEIDSGTLDETWAAKAKSLVTHNPELALPQNKARLLDKVGPFPVFAILVRRGTPSEVITSPLRDMSSLTLGADAEDDSPET